MLSSFFSSVIIASETSGNGSLLDVNPGLIFWTVVTFLILLLILSKTAWKPILSALNEREKKIEDALTSADRAREEAERLIKQNEANQLKAQEEAKKLLDTVREDAVKLREKLMQDAHDDAKKLKEDAALEIERKTAEAFTQLKSSVADLAINAAEKILKEKLDANENSKIVNQYINDIKKN